MDPRFLAAAVVPSLLVSCTANTHQPPEKFSSSASNPVDEHSHANPDQVRVTHIALALELDFTARRAGGSVRLDLERIDPQAPLVLDSMALEILRVLGVDRQPRRFELGPERAGFGQPLRIFLEPGDTWVSIDYRTTEGAEAMQWLAPEQTAGGARPFLFTQGQAILTRTWIPLQDSPGVRVTYEARIEAPDPLVVVMSAEQLGQDRSGAFRFRMPHPIPPYLIALACGDLAFQAISTRAGVWAEPPVVGGAAAELEDTEAMISTAESLFGPYRWGRYDILILPPAFPYGGMENPCLTFATPTILAGDKSLVALVAHELSHSWSGNLVTNATWRDFWLNEGFTTYIENRIMEAVYGLERARMEQVLGLADLREEMAGQAPRDQVLHVDLSGRHPDDGFSTVPYEKAALFLRRLEVLYGRAAFDALLRGWFEARAFQSVTTDDFRAWLVQALPDVGGRIDLDLWLDQPGLPGDAPTPSSEALSAVERAVQSWRSGTPAAELDSAGWVTQQWLHFLEQLPNEVNADDMTRLDDAFHLTDSGNGEILCAWLVLAIRQGYHPADARLEEFLMNVGRRKFLKPLYAELAKTDAGLARAREIYARARPRYHAVATRTLDEILGWKA